MEALGHASTLFAPSASWLIDNLVEIRAPQPGDLVGYGRAAIGDEAAS
jgi:hypothetical protein